MTIRQVYGGDVAIIPTKEAIKRLGISKAGLYKWIKKKVLVKRTYRWGGRIYHGFKDKEIDELKKRLKHKGWTRGMSLIDKGAK